MGKFKRLLMAREDTFWQHAQSKLSEYETYKEFLFNIRPLIVEYMQHRDTEEVEAELYDGWEDYQVKLYEERNA